MDLLALSLAPIIFIMTYVYGRDEYDHEPLSLLLKSFVLGVLIALPVVYFGELLTDWWEVGSDSPFLQRAVYAFIVVAAVEEGMKYLVLRAYCYRLAEFDEPYDGIMYAVTVSLGFAAIENILYVFWYGGESIGLLRMFTAVPVHAILGVIMGYYVGLAKFSPAQRPYWLRKKGLLLAILFHGTYDFFLFLDYEWLYLAAIILIALGIFFSRRAMHKHKALSPRNPDREFLE